MKHTYDKVNNKEAILTAMAEHVLLKNLLAEA